MQIMTYLQDIKNAGKGSPLCGGRDRILWIYRELVWIFTCWLSVFLVTRRFCLPAGLPGELFHLISGMVVKGSRVLLVRAHVLMVMVVVLVRPIATHATPPEICGRCRWCRHAVEETVGRGGSGRWNGSGGHLVCLSCEVFLEEMFEKYFGVIAKDFTRLFSLLVFNIKIVGPLKFMCVCSK